MDFQEVKRPLRTKSAKRPIKVGKRPINEGKRPIKAKVLVGVSVGCLMGCFRAPQPWRKTAPLKRPIKRSMRNVLSREPSGDRIARSCRHTVPDLTVKTEAKDRIAKGLLSQDRKTHFETTSLPVAKILSPVTRQAPTKSRESPHGSSQMGAWLKATLWPHMCTIVCNSAHLSPFAVKVQIVL